jgi:hypothetical protein
MVKLLLSQDRPFTKFETGGGFSFFRIGQFGQVLNYPASKEGLFITSILRFPSIPL